MGTYVYALNTKIREFSGKKIGVAEFRYKESFSWENDINQKSYNLTCRRRVAFFEKNPDQVPEFFVYGLSQDASVFKLKSVVFDDTEKFERVGALVKRGHSWVINFLKTE